MVELIAGAVVEVCRGFFIALGAAPILALILWWVQ